MPLRLIGMKGSGKSTMGQALATRTGRPFLDTDLLIEDASGLAVVEVFEEEGEAAFRVRESAAIPEAADHIVVTDDSTVEEVAMLVEKIWNAS